MSGSDRAGGRSLSQLSGTLAAAASGGGVHLDAALRAALAQQPRPSHRQQSVPVPVGAPFASWAAFNSDRPGETLAMFKRLSSRDGKPGEQAQRPGHPAPDSDSARHTEAETEANSPPCQGSLMAGTADGSWAGSSGEQGSAERLGAHPPGQQPSEQQAGQLSSASAFAPAAARQFSAPPSAPPSVSSRDASPLPPEPSNLRADLLLQLPRGRSPTRPPPFTASAYYSTAGAGGGSVSSGGSLAGERWQLHGEAGGGGGGDFDTPRSAVSWVSSMALPQTEAELAGLEWQEVEQLAAEAAELQQRAALALRLARQRMQGGGGSGAAGSGGSAGLESFVPGLVFRPSGRGSGGAGQQSVAAADSEQRQGLATDPAGAAPAAAAAAAEEKGPASPLQLPLQLALLLLAAAEAALLFCAALAQQASCGLLRLPRSLVTAPASAVRASVLAAVVFAELALRLLTSLWRTAQGVGA